MPIGIRVSTPDRASWREIGSAVAHTGGAMTATVVLVHGGGGSSATWDRVVPLLDGLGVPSVAVELPSCLPESVLEDAGAVRLALDECVGPVVLAGQSWGGMVASRVGTHPSVKHLVYLD